MALNFYNTLTRTKARFEPLDAANVRMYVCGPTVYDFVHIGNGRPVIVFDTLFRLLRHTYGPAHVTYARNITDVDDKINARALEQMAAQGPSGSATGDVNAAIAKLTAETTAQYHRDCESLGALAPTVEPRATEHMPEMRALIEALVAKGHAYVAEGHVLFAVGTIANFGALSGRSKEEMEAGARVEIAPYKRDPMDFVLWKPSKPGEPGWPSPCGIAGAGRPGWHIECSAMAAKHLGQTFDIHGGGVDLVFPHHENEIAQSCCGHGTPFMAKVFMHNGFVQVEGQKMSKSLGNFITINQLVATDTFGGQRWPGRVCRLAMLGTAYRSPIDWTVERLVQARQTMMEFAETIHDVDASAPEPEFLAALSDDLNTPSAISILHGMAKSARKGNRETAAALRASLELIGLYAGETREAFADGQPTRAIDRVRVEALVADRLQARRTRNFKESDRLRDELLSLGVVIKDGKDPDTGEPFTTWDVRA
ncbi:MAG: cysteine--tRNA ligase [Hyphomicrobiaceae bacterium]|nr:cysteine--tRNA ligase [Hyphomicrobiaceae bacterium]